jgi:hypothetical protein
MCLYVLLTGALPQGLQGALYGLPAGAETAFAVYLLSALAVDALRLAPLLILVRNPVGLLHPLVLMVLVWPAINGLPFIDQQLNGLAGLVSGQPVLAPYLNALPGRAAVDIWWGTAAHNGLQALGWIAAYAVFALTAPRARDAGRPIPLGPPADPRLYGLLLVAVGSAVVGALAFVVLRGGFDAHMQALAGGRFYALAGLGPILALLDIGVIAAVVWILSFRGAERSPVFIAAVVGLAACQFLSNGSRSAALSVAIVLGLAWCLRSGRVPWRAALVAVPILLAAYGALTVARTSAWRGQAASASLRQLDLQDALARAQSDTAARMAQRGGVPVIMEGFDRTGGPLWGRTYVAAAAAMVPRALWPDKPRGPGSTFARTFHGSAREGTTIPIGSVGEAWWNFGAPGVVIIFGLFGGMMRLALNLYLRRPDEPFVAAAYLIFVTQFHVGTEALVRFQQSMLLLGLLWLTYAVIRRRSFRPVVPVQPRRASTVSMTAR